MDLTKDEIYKEKFVAFITELGLNNIENLINEPIALIRLLGSKMKYETDRMTNDFNILFKEVNKQRKEIKDE